MLVKITKSLTINTKALGLEGPRYCTTVGQELDLDSKTISAISERAGVNDWYEKVAPDKPELAEEVAPDKPEAAKMKGNKKGAAK